MTEKSLEAFIKSKMNFGTRILNDAPIGQQATIAATGLGRSGTTMLARILKELGLQISSSSSPHTLDDKEIQVAVRRQAWDELEQVLRERDAQHDIWAFKDPKIRGNLYDATQKMRNPRVLVTFRDILAVSIRNELSVNSEIWDSLRMATKGYIKLLDELKKLSCPVLMLSYEKCLTNPQGTVTTIANFCGVSPDANRDAEIAELAIRNSDPRYFSHNFSHSSPK